MSDYLLSSVALWAIFGSAASVVAFLADQARIVHVGAGAVMGVGSYTAALLATKLGWNPWVALATTIPAGLLLGLCFHLITVRLTGDSLALATLALAVILYGLMLNLAMLTNGPMGVASIPKLAPLLGNQAVDLFVLALLIVIVLAAIRKTAFGRRVRALRDDEELADNLGLRVGRVRAALFLASSAILALVGGFYAFVVRFIDPSSFALRESITVLAMALMFRVRLPARGALGAFFFVALPEIQRFFPISPSNGAHIRMMFFAVALIFVAARMPEMVGEHSLARGKAHA